MIRRCTHHPGSQGLRLLFISKTGSSSLNRCRQPAHQLPERGHEDRRPGHHDVIAATCRVGPCSGGRGAAASRGYGAPPYPPSVRRRTPFAADRRAPGATKTVTPPLRRRVPFRRTLRRSDRVRSEANGRPLGGETPAALPPAAPKDGAAGARAHARSEAVLALSTAYIRLVGALHVAVIPRPSQGTEPRGYERPDSLSKVGGVKRRSHAFSREEWS